MTCKIARPEPQVLFDRIRDMFSVSVLGGAPVIQESNEWYVVSNDYAMHEQFYAIADQMWRETNPETACCDNLVTMAARNGVFPRPATFTQGYARLHGTPAADLPNHLEIVTDAGTFESTGLMPLQIGSDGTAITRIKSLTPGVLPNTTSIITGQLETSIPNVDNTVDICGGIFCGGTPAETCEQFRVRYLNRLAYKPRATSAWIKDQLMSWPCVTRVCERAGSCCHCGPDDECGCLSCSDKLEFYVMFDNSFPCGIAPGNVINDLRVWVFGERQGYGEGLVEIGVCGNIYAPIAVPLTIVVDIIGCPTVTQKQLIEANIRDLFLKICPSTVLRKQQIQLIVAQVIGSEFNSDIQFDVGDAPVSQVFQNDCGDLEFECDYMPCLTDVEFIGGGTVGDIC